LTFFIYIYDIHKMSYALFDEFGFFDVLVILILYILSVFIGVFLRRNKEFIVPLLFVIMVNLYFYVYKGLYIEGMTNNNASNITIYLLFIVLCVLYIKHVI
jgi:hypothetical protein